MKKQTIALAFAVLTGGILVFTGCSKTEDTTAPSINLTGGSTVQYSLPTTAGGAGTWTDPGFSATDDEDGTITASVSVTNNVNLNRKGSYTATYSVSDKAGNNTTVQRTINVVNDAENFAGTYNNCTDTCTGPPQTTAGFIATIATSDTVNNLVTIGNFGAFNNTATSFVTKIYVSFNGYVAGSTLTIGTGTSQGLGGSAYLQSVYPSPATGVLTPTPNTSFKIKYQWTDGSASDVCTSYYIR
jgi:hypothetical protein